MIPLPVIKNESLRKQLELSALHLNLEWTDPVSGISGRGLTELLWHIRCIKTGETKPLCDVSEKEFQILNAESERWIR